MARMASGCMEDLCRGKRRTAGRVVSGIAMKERQMRNKRLAQTGAMQRTGDWGNIRERGAGQRSGASKGVWQRSEATRKLLAVGV